MYHQQHRATRRKPAHRRRDVGLGRPVQRGRRLVQQQHGAVGKEGPGQREPLSLACGQPGPVLPEHRAGSLGKRVHELQRTGLPECLADGGVVRVGPGQPYVLRDGPGVQVRPLRHPGDPRPPLLQVGLGEIDGPDAHPALAGPHEPQQHVEQCRLARPARSDEGHGLAGLHGQRHVGHGVRRPPRIADRHSVEGHGARGHRRGPGRRDRCLQDGEDLLGRREPLRRRVVLRAHLAQRQVRLGGQHQDDQTDVQVHVAVHQAHADRHGDQRHRQGGQQLQRERGEKGDPQGPQGGLAVLTGDPANGVCLGLGPAEHLQCGQTGDHVQEVAREPGQQPPLTVHPGLRGPADQHHEEGDQRQGADDDCRGHPVLGDDPREHGCRDDHREPQLGEVPREVVVQGVRPACGQGDQGAGSLTAQPPGTQVGGASQQPPAQLRFHRGAGAVCGEFGEPRDNRPARGHGSQQQQGGAQFSDRLPVPEGPDHHLGNEHGLGDDQPGADGPQADDRHQKEAGGAGVSQEARIDRFHVKHALRPRGCVSRETHPRRTQCAAPAAASGAMCCVPIRLRNTQ